MVKKTEWVHRQLTTSVSVCQAPPMFVYIQVMATADPETDQESVEVTFLPVVAIQTSVIRRYGKKRTGMNDPNEQGSHEDYIKDGWVFQEEDVVTQAMILSEEYNILLATNDTSMEYCDTVGRLHFPSYEDPAREKVIAQLTTEAISQMRARQKRQAIERAVHNSPGAVPTVPVST